jgi:RecA-family ATPase
MARAKQLHLHWRLAKPARGGELAKLKEARQLATQIAGGDPSNMPVVHPIRWPGSWHRKAEPRLCEIETLNADHEIDLAAALGILTAAAPQPKSANNTNSDNDNATDDWPALVADIISGRSYHAPLVSLAARLVGSGMYDGTAVKLLRSMMAASSAPRDARWHARYDAISRIVSSARDKYTADTAPPVALPFINMSNWDTTSTPAREWAVRDRIPLRQPTLFSGEGAVGKTIVELQLCVAHVLGRDWLDTMPEPGPAIYLGAEDEADELRRRLTAIAEHYDRTTFAELIAGGLHLLSFAGEDALLGVPDRQGKIVPTPLFQSLLEAARDIRPKHIGLDTSADVFGGNEIDRSQVRQFVGLLRKLAIAANGSVVLLSHPSLQGINSGSGLSGSTGWHNSVRARMYLKSAKGEEGEQPDTDLRELEFKKNNYGPVSESLVLRFRDGLFIPEAKLSTLDKLAHDQRVDDTFLAVLRKLIGQNRPVSPSAHASNYAPGVIANCPDGKGYKRKDYAEAMERLLAARLIHVETFGPPSKQRWHLALGAAN